MHNPRERYFVCTGVVYIDFKLIGQLLHKLPQRLDFLHGIVSLPLLCNQLPLECVVAQQIVALHLLQNTKKSLTTA